MNYRHIYHAGNICDVVKHAALTLVIDHLRTKEAPFCILDTHAGIGAYDLQDERAAKTDEAKDGVLKFLAALDSEMFPSRSREGLGVGQDVSHAPQHSEVRQTPRPPSMTPCVIPPASGREVLANYLAVLAKINPAGGHRYYPGSPLLAAHLLRPQDRLIACELHPEDAAELKHQMYPFKQAQVHLRDGYRALEALLPPVEKRGLVLIDPSFEAPDEFTQLAKAVQAAYAKWPQGIYMLWYPIKERAAIWKFHEALVASGMKKILAAEFMYQEETRADRLNGSGLIFINPPWQLDEQLTQLFALLHQALQTPHQGCLIKYLVGNN